MNQSTVEPTNTEDTEALFRRVMSGVTDRLWNLRLVEEALAALYDVIEKGVEHEETSGNHRGDVLPE